MSEVKTVTVAQEVSNTIMNMKPEFEEMLRKTGVDPDRFTRCAIMAVQTNPGLLECTKPSLYKAVSTCARWGLIPDGQEAAIVKFGNEAVAMDMIEGVLKLFRNSGECGCVDAKVVYEKDTYDSWTDEKGVHFNHKPFRGKDKGDVILTYAYAITKDGHLYFEEVSTEDMLKIESVARTKTVWQGAFRHEMFRKSALRRLSKRLPKSTDIEMAMDRHDEGFDVTGAEDAQPEKPAGEATTSSRLGNVIEAQVVPKSDKPSDQPVDAPLPAEEPEQAPKLIQGLITNHKKTQSLPGAPKQWTRYGALVDNKWYGTFDTKIYDVIMKCLTNKIPVEIVYIEVVKDNKIYFEIKSMRELTAGDMAKTGDMPF